MVNKKLQDMKFIDKKSYSFLSAAKAIEFAGFTEESYNWIFTFKTVSLSELKLIDLSLSSLWKNAN